MKILEVRRWKPDLAPSEDLLIVENGRFLHRDGDHDEAGVPVAIVKVKTVRPSPLQTWRQLAPPISRKDGLPGKPASPHYEDAFPHTLRSNDA
jgi:hypothetical protein